MKKILVLGSASVHVKLIKAAQEMGVRESSHQQDTAEQDRHREP